MPRRVRVTGTDGEWVAELGANGVTLSGVSGAFVVTDEGAGRFLVDDSSAAAAGVGDVVWVSIDGHVFEFQVTQDAGAARPASRDQDALSPPMSATVVRIAVKPGDRVHDGDVLIALEAMKMELPIRSPADATVTAVHCREGELVQPDAVLVTLS